VEIASDRCAISLTGCAVITRRIRGISFYNIVIIALNVYTGAWHVICPVFSHRWHHHPEAPGMIHPNAPGKKHRDTRFSYRGPIIKENLETGMVVIGQMQNYSIGGFCFESNAAFEPRQIVFLGIPDSPYAASEVSLYECHRVSIRWRKTLYRSRYRHAYGVQHLDPIGIDPEFTERYYCDVPEYKNDIPDVAPEMRRFRRKPLSAPVYFTARDRLSSGLIRDISRDGIFIETGKSPKAGRIIRLVIPGTIFDKGIMLEGQIVRQNVAGFGVQFSGIKKM
jgi:hypothetical protein